MAAGIFKIAHAACLLFPSDGAGLNRLPEAGPIGYHRGPSEERKVRTEDAYSRAVEEGAKLAMQPLSGAAGLLRPGEAALCAVGSPIPCSSFLLPLAWESLLPPV